MFCEKDIGLRQRFRLAYVEPVSGLLPVQLDMCLPAHGQVEGDDGERSLPSAFLHEAEDGGRQHMYASEGPALQC